MVKVDLLPHNQKAYDNLIEHWRTHNKAAIVHPTGSGKSFIILQCLYDFNNMKKVVLSSSSYIFNQSKKYAHKYGKLKNIEYIVYHKLPFMSKEQIEQIHPSLIVLDEFHRCGAPEWGKGVQILLDSFPNAKVLGTTATPIRYLDNKRDMSDELFNGNVVSNIDFWDAVLDEILPTPLYISGLYSLTHDTNKLMNDIDSSYSSESEKLELKLRYNNMKNQLENSKGVPEILKNNIKDCNGKFIIFCKDINHLKEMQSSVVEWFSIAKLTKNGIRTYKVHSENPDKSSEFKRFEDDKNEGMKLLFSVAMLNEGVHVPGITGVIFLRCTKSPTIYLQQMGRGVASDGIEHPLILDLVSNCENLGGYREGLKKAVERRDCSKEEKHRLMEEQDFYIREYSREFIELCKDIRSKLDDGWMFMFRQLAVYKERHGDCHVLKRYIKLEKWCSHQRTAYKKGLLSYDKIKSLEDIGFVWDVFKTNFQKMINELKIYKTKYGDCNVPQNFGQLGSWCSNQRVAYKKNLLSKKKIAELESIGFVWDFIDTCWLKMIEELRTYKVIHGDCNVPKRYGQLGNWCSNQRTSNKKGLLSKDKFDELESMGFIWDIREVNFQKMLDELKIYKTEHGNCDVPIGYGQLGNWCSAMRQARKNEKLSQERIDLLDSIGFQWEIRTGRLNRSKIV